MTIFPKKKQFICQKKLARFLLVAFLFVVVSGAYMVGEESGLGMSRSIKGLQHEITELKDEIELLKKQIRNTN